MKRSVLILLCSILHTIQLAVAAQGDPEKGKILFQKQCQSCHGEKAEGNKVEEAPSLAGQFDWYLFSQLESFKAKKRKNPKMDPFIRDLSQQDFHDLAAYLSQLK